MSLKVYTFSSHKLVNICFIVFISINVVLCNPPCGRLSAEKYLRPDCRENSYSSQRRVHTDKYQQISPDGTTIEIYPHGVQILPDPDTRDDELTLKVFERDSRLPRNCPTNFGIYQQNGQCYRFASHNVESRPEESPCPPFMDFFKDPNNPRFGDCDCKEKQNSVNRPVVYWYQTNRCYWLFDQGPCYENQWLVLNDNNQPICSKRSCPENSPQDWSQNPREHNKKKYWFRHRGKCYQSETKGYCDDPTHTPFYEVLGDGYEVTCKLRAETRFLLNGVKQLPCMPGHRKSMNGQCSRITTYE